VLSREGGLAEATLRLAFSSNEKIVRNELLKAFLKLFAIYGNVTFEVCSLKVV
jgi:hypothetical protein